MSRVAIACAIALIAVSPLRAGVCAAAEPPAASATPQEDAAPHSHGPGHEHVGGHTGPPWEGLQDVELSEAFTFRPERGETAVLRYRLTEPARVQIRVRALGTRELYLASLVDWEMREPGEHAEFWDGRDYSGNLVDMSEATITLIAQKDEHEPGSMPLETKSAEEIVHAEEEHLHGSHHAWAEEVPALTILEPRPNAEVSDLLLIRTRVDEDRRGYGNLYGYGVRYYVDGELVREEFYKPESEGRFAYRLDTTAFANGEHLLRVGMCDHHQHATSASVPVVFRNGR